MIGDYKEKLSFLQDVQLTASNDDQYFVFEDVLYKTMLNFSRDSEVLPTVTTDKSAGGQVIHAVLQGKPANLENTLVFPPSGVIPFHGFTMYGKSFKSFEPKVFKCIQIINCFSYSILLLIR